MKISLKKSSKLRQKPTFVLSEKIWIFSLKTAEPDWKKFKVDPRQEDIKIQKYILTKNGEKSTRCRFMIKPEHEFTKYIWKKQNDENV